jgi:CheY-like chemotaxis protein
VIGKDVRLHRHFDADLDFIRMDRAQLQQVVLNLCVNGRDAMPDGGVVTVRTANLVLDDLHAAQQIDVAPGSYVLLEITDSGVGMDLETQARAFDPFFTTKSEGTGLGLSTVFGAVRQAGGSVSIYSELGIGTSFKVYLPQASVEDLPVAATDAQVSEERYVTILLVEDYDVLRALGVRILESIGHRVFAAASGRDALELFEEHLDEIDLLLTDMMMPQMSGQELAGMLLERKPDLRVIFTSGYPALTAFDDPVSSKRIAFIQKPYTTSELSSRIQAVLAGHQ